MGSLRTLDLEPGIKLLGFKDRSELTFDDNVRHSLFIYPDEESYAGSRRTFTALLSSMVKKGKVGLVRALTRRNASPSFCVLLPQEEGEGDGWAEPSGFHLIPLPFADDIRAAPIEEGFRGGPPHSFTPSKLPLALSSARVSQRAKSLLMQQNHLSPSLRSGIALTHLTLTLTPVSTFPHLCQLPAQPAWLCQHWPSTTRSSRQLRSARSSIQLRSTITPFQRTTRSTRRQVH